mgnify:CR=1 FL=1
MALRMSAAEFWQHPRIRGTLDIVRQRLHTIADILPETECNARQVEDLEMEVSDIARQLLMLSMYLEDPPFHYAIHRLSL